MHRLCKIVVRIYSRALHIMRGWLGRRMVTTPQVIVVLFVVTFLCTFPLDTATRYPVLHYHRIE